MKSVPNHPFTVNISASFAQQYLLPGEGQPFRGGTGGGGNASYFLGGGFDALVDPTQVVPIVYGRRRITGKVFEQSNMRYGDRLKTEDADTHRVFFCALSEGPISGVERYFVNGEEITGEVTSGTDLITFGAMYHLGTSGVSGIIYEADQVNQLWGTFPQGQNYLSATSQTYPYTAYAIAIFQNNNENQSPEESSVPSMEFDVVGKKIQQYDSTGTPAGEPTWSRNPIWQLVDYTTESLYGLNFSSGLIDWEVAKTNADYAGEIIDSQKAWTRTNTTIAGSNTIYVDNAEGFRIGEQLTIGDVAGNYTVLDIISDTVLKVDRTIGSASSGVYVQQRIPRFASDYAIMSSTSADSVIQELLLNCRGYITQSEGKIQFNIERPHITEYIPSGVGGFELWTDATHPSGWSVDYGTVNREDTITNGGDYSIKFDGWDDIFTDNYASITRDDIDLPQGAWYKLTADVYCTKTTDEAIKFVLIDHDGNYLQEDGSFGTGTNALRLSGTQDTWRSHSVYFRLPRYTTPTYDTCSLQIYPSMGAPGAGEYTYLDNITIRGPYAGIFKESGNEPGYGIIKDSFKVLPRYDDQRINHMEVSYINEAGDTGNDLVTIDDWDRQAKGRHTRSFSTNSIVLEEQAERIGKFHFDKATKTVPGAAFVAGPGSLAVQPGDVILVSHTLPDWSHQECRVRDIEEYGLGDDRELLSSLAVEKYNADIYHERTALQLDPITRPDGLLKLYVYSASMGNLSMAAALSGVGYNVNHYAFYGSLTSGVEIKPSNLVKRTPSAWTVINVPEKWFGKNVYFKVRASTDRAPIDSEVVAGYISKVGVFQLEGDAGQAGHPNNLVYGGEFEDSSKWEDVSTGSGSYYVLSGYGDYTNEAGALQVSGEASAYVSASYEASDSKTSTWEAADNGTANVTLFAKHKITRTGGPTTQSVYYSTDAGANWTSFGSSTTSWQTSSVGLSGIDTANLKFKATTTAQQGTEGFIDPGEGTGYVSELYYQTQGTAQAEWVVSGSYVNLEAASGTTAMLRRNFPGKYSKSNMTLLIPSGRYTTSVYAWQKTSGVVPNDDLYIDIQAQDGSWQQTLFHITSGMVPCREAKFQLGKQVVINSGIPSKPLYIRVHTTATSGYSIDKLQVTQGKLTWGFQTNPAEQVEEGGFIADYSETTGPATPPDSAEDPTDTGTEGQSSGGTTGDFFKPGTLNENPFN